ncbi:MAG TPA: hypothetical protein VJA21_14975 [Verrucomicrobiae bacterium]
MMVRSLPSPPAVGARDATVMNYEGGGNLTDDRAGINGQTRAQGVIRERAGAAPLASSGGSYQPAVSRRR